MNIVCHKPQRSSCIAYKLLFLCGSSKWYQPTCKQRLVVSESLFFSLVAIFGGSFLLLNCLHRPPIFAFVFQNYSGSIFLSISPM